MLSSTTLQLSSTVTLAINKIPVVNNNTSTISEDAVLKVAARGVLSNDIDTDTNNNNLLTVTASDTISTNGAKVTVNADGSYTYDPTKATTIQALGAGTTLNDTFNYTISDANGDTATAKVTVIVTGVNDSPVNTVPGEQTVDEDISLDIYWQQANQH